MQRVPEHLRHPEGLWYGFSQRLRVIFYSKDECGSRGGVQLRGSGGSGARRQRLRALLQQHLQPVAARFHDQSSRRGRGQRLGRAGWSRPGPDAAGRRPDQILGAASGEMRVRPGESLATTSA
ncbi:MAG: hypothetical protein U5R48_18830 [Gammaproteobacteria bacterium]|nr:hypothetical protein [Gammaproteobacteria bacterium]